MAFFKKKKKEKELFVSIAAGKQQLPLILAAKKLGYKTIAVDRDGEALGFALANIKIQESTENFEEIYQKLQELLIDGKISVILSRSYGAATETVAHLCEKLSIPFINTAHLLPFTDKCAMKETLLAHNITTPPHTLYNARKKRGYHFPLVAKPAIGHAKSGVKLIDSIEELSIQVEKIRSKKSPRAKIIIEEFIGGDELILFGLVKDGVFYLHEITDKITTPTPYFVDLTHSAPSKFLDKKKELTDLGSTVAKAFSITTAPLIIELKHYNDTFYVIEVAPEFGGEYIPDYLIPITTNQSFFGNAIDAMAKKDFTPLQIKKRRGAVVIQFITGSTGYLHSYTPLDCKKEGLVMYSIFKKIGDKITPPKTNHHRVGVVIAAAKNIEIAQAICNQAIEKLNIQYVRKKNELKKS